MHGMTTAQPTKPRYRVVAPFDPLPWQVAPWRDKSRILLLTGAAGGGKSRLAGEKIHGYCLKFSGATGLIARKAKTSMSAGTILFLRRKIVGGDPNVRWVDSPKFRFEYRNGSILQFIGLLDETARDNLKSIGQDGAVDIAWMEEGTQFDEEDLNATVARMRGKAANWRQIILTTNPDAPMHWIKRRLIDGGEASVYYSRAADNFHNPADYALWLSTLTGIDKQRLVDGLWVQASGLVYDVWSDGPPDGNVTEAAEYLPDGGDVRWAVDDGYEGSQDPKTGYFTEGSSPRVFLLVQLRGDGRICIFAESYECKTLEEEQIKRVRAMDYPDPDLAVVDSAAAELRGRLHKMDIATLGKPPLIEPSISITRRMLAPDMHGRRRILVHPRCRQLRAEMASYRRDPTSGKPIDAFNHGPDALRYISFSLRHED
jgi:phage terminase large subunit